MFQMFQVVLLSFALRYGAFVFCEEASIEFSSGYGSFATPNYPDSYPTNLTYRWTINAPDGTSIQLNFTDFYVEPNKKCLYDYVIINDSSGNRTSNRICGGTVPSNYLSKGNRLKIVFVSDLTHSFRGFQAVWRSIIVKRKENDDAKLKDANSSASALICASASTITRTFCPSTAMEPRLLSSTPCLCSQDESLSATSPTRLSTKLSSGETETSIVSKTTVYLTSTVTRKLLTTTTVILLSPTSLRPKAKKKEKSQHVSSATEQLVKCISNLPHEEQGGHRKEQRVALILGILVAVFATLNIMLFFIWLQFRTRSTTSKTKTKSIPKTELFDRILFLPNMNGIIRTKDFWKTRNLQ